MKKSTKIILGFTTAIALATGLFLTKSDDITINPTTTKLHVGIDQSDWILEKGQTVTVTTDCFDGSSWLANCASFTVDGKGISVPESFEEFDPRAYKVQKVRVSVEGPVDLSSKIIVIQQ